MGIMKFTIFVLVLATMCRESFQKAILGSCKEYTKKDKPRVVVELSDLLSVMCDTETDGGGWLVIERRTTGHLRFYRGMSDFTYGFGDVRKDEFWLGLQWVHLLTSHRDYELRVDMTYDGKNYFAKYGRFRVMSGADKYRLVLKDFDPSSTVKDSFGYANNMAFSAKDQDNDESPINCAEKYHSAGWFKKCHLANPFGNWGDKEFGKGINWLSVTGHHATIQFLEMKIRPRD